MTPKKECRKYAMKGKKDKHVYLEVSSMMYPATSQIEICAVPEVRASLTANQVELAWFTRYLLPNLILEDRGIKILTEFKTIMTNDYEIP